MQVKSANYALQNEKLHGELATKSKACLDCESQLHRVQSQMVEELDGKERDIDRLRAEIEKLKVLKCVCVLCSIICVNVGIIP